MGRVAAAEAKVVTQMGNNGHEGEGLRLTKSGSMPARSVR